MSNRNFALPRTETPQPMITAPAPNNTTPNNPQGNPPPPKKSMPVWAWILIILGIIALIALIVIVIWHFTSRKKQVVTTETVHAETKAGNPSSIIMSSTKV